MSRLSAVVIAFNEEKRIADCLRSLQPLADEILLVDSGSTDRTVEIAKSLNARVLYHPFEGHVQQKNFAMQQASFDWVLSLDADEVLSKELQASILNIKEKGFNNMAYSFNRLNNYCGTWLKHGGWYPDRKIRLWHRSVGHWGGLNPHDQVILQKGVEAERLAGDLLHYTYDSVEAHLQQMDRFARISAQAYFERGKRTHTLEVWLNPVFSFVRDYVLRAGFLDGRAGWTANRIAMRYQYWKYKHLLHLQKAKR